METFFKSNLIDVNSYTACSRIKKLEVSIISDVVRNFLSIYALKRIGIAAKYVEKRRKNVQYTSVGFSVGVLIENESDSRFDSSKSAKKASIVFVGAFESFPRMFQLLEWNISSITTRNEFPKRGICTILTLKMLINILRRSSNEQSRIWGTSNSYVGSQSHPLFPLSFVSFKTQATNFEFSDA